MSEGETAAPTPNYAQVRGIQELGGNFVKAKDFPNGLEVTVVGLDIRPGFKVTHPRPDHPEDYDAYWKVTAPELDGEKLVKETTPMSKKLADLDIEDPTGRSFILTQVEIQGNKTFQIARAL